MIDPRTNQPATPAREAELAREQGRHPNPGSVIDPRTGQVATPERAAELARESGGRNPATDPRTGQPPTPERADELAREHPATNRPVSDTERTREAGRPFSDPRHTPSGNDPRTGLRVPGYPELRDVRALIHVGMTQQEVDTVLAQLNTFIPPV